MGGPGRARCVPDRTVSGSASGVLTVTREHALTWALAVLLLSSGGRGGAAVSTWEMRAALMISTRKVRHRARCSQLPAAGTGVGLVKGSRPSFIKTSVPASGSQLPTCRAARPEPSRHAVHDPHPGQARGVSPGSLGQGDTALSAPSMTLI